MANYFYLTIDETAPAGVTCIINSGDATTAMQQVSLLVDTTDFNPQNYEVLIWGDIDNSVDPEIQSTEAASTWRAYDPLLKDTNVTLSSGGGTKTLYAKLRDSGWNASSQASDTITLLAEGAQLQMII